MEIYSSGMLLLLLAVILTATNAYSHDWQRFCKACSLPETAQCQSRPLADRTMAEILLKSVPETKDWLSGCGNVDILHIDFNMNNIESSLTMDGHPVNTLVLSNVASVLPGTLAEVTRDDAHSVIFSNVRELGRGLPNVGRIGFVGALDESVAAMFPKHMPQENSLIIKFEPSFAGLIDAPGPELFTRIDSLLIEITSSSQFLLVTEEMIKANRKPIVNVIVNVDDEEDMLSNDFLQKLALFASAIEIKKHGVQMFTSETMPTRFFINLIRFMFVTYHHIRNWPGSSDLEIVFQADRSLNALSKISAISPKPYKDGFRCRLNIKKLFTHIEHEMHQMNKGVSQQTYGQSLGSGSFASTFSASSGASEYRIAPRRSLQEKYEPHLPATKEINQDNTNGDSKKLPSEDKLEGTPRDTNILQTPRNDNVNNDMDQCGGSCEIVQQEVLDYPKPSEKGNIANIDENQNDQALSPSKLSHPDNGVISTDQESKPKQSSIDSPIVMVLIIVGSVVMLTIAAAAIFVSKRRRLKQAMKLQAPTASKEETDPETLWW